MKAEVTAPEVTIHHSVIITMDEPSMKMRNNTSLKAVRTEDKIDRQTEQSAVVLAHQSHRLMIDYACPPCRVVRAWFFVQILPGGRQIWVTAIGVNASSRNPEESMCNKGFRALQYVQLIGIPSKKEAGEEEEGSASHLLLPSAPLLFFWHHFHAIDLVQKSLQFATLAMIFWSQNGCTANLRTTEIPRPSFWNPEHTQDKDCTSAWREALLKRISLEVRERRLWTALGGRARHSKIPDKATLWEMEYPGHCYSTLERAVGEESFEGIAPVLFSRHICRWFYSQVSAQKADNLILWSTGHVEYRPFLNKHNDCVPEMLHYAMDSKWICIMFVWNCRAVTNFFAEWSCR